MTTLQTKLAGWAITATLLAPGVLAAEVGKPLRAWLLAMESVPTSAQLVQAGGPQVDAVLDAVVHDGHEATYARHRALSFLGILATPKATERLRQNLKLADPALRATGAVAWAAGPGRVDARKAMPALDKLLDDAVPAVRAAAARGLLFLPDAKLARDHAAKRRAKENHPEVLQALDRTMRQLDGRAR